MVLNLSSDERSRIASGALLTATDGDSQLQCVVVRADLFERFRYLFDETPDAALQDIAESLADFEPEDWKTPEEWRGIKP